MMFIIYNIAIINHETRNLKNVKNGATWEELKDKPTPLSVKEFSVMITDIDKNYEGDIVSDIRNSFNKYGNIE